VQLSDLICAVSRLWTPLARIPGRKVMLIPFIKDINKSLQAATVAAQCAACAMQLAGSLYVWRKPFPGKATVKSWSTDTQSFIGMTIEDFATFLMANFTLRTTDGKEWLADKVVADHIWQSCTDADSPLPLASWEEEITLKRRAARLKESGK
jgi:hypothetical protein